MSGRQRATRSFLQGLVLSALLILAACAGPLTATPNPTPTRLVVAAAPEVDPLLPALQACGQAHPDFAIEVQETPAEAIDLNQVDFAIRLGQPEAEATYSAPLAQDELVLVVNTGNSTGALSVGEVRQLFSGQTEQWEATGAPVQAWVYPPGSPLRQAFDSAVMGGEPVASQAWVAPGPAEMLAAIQKDPGAVGYVPRAWLDDQVRMVEVDANLQSALRLPVLALSKGEPEGAANVLLGCLQQGQGQKPIREKYLAWEP